MTRKKLSKGISLACSAVLGKKLPLNGRNVKKYASIVFISSRIHMFMWMLGKICEGNDQKGASYIEQRTCLSFSEPVEWRWCYRNAYRVTLSWSAIRLPRYVQIDPLSKEIYIKCLKQDHYNLQHPVADNKFTATELVGSVSAVVDAIAEQWLVNTTVISTAEFRWFTLSWWNRNVICSLLINIWF